MRIPGKAAREVRHAPAQNAAIEQRAPLRAPGQTDLLASDPQNAEPPAGQQQGPGRPVTSPEEGANVPALGGGLDPADQSRGVDMRGLPLEIAGYKV